MWYAVIHRETGEAVSVGTVVADPLPAELVAMPLSEADADALNTCRALWDAVSRSVVMRPESEWPTLPE